MNLRKEQGLLLGTVAILALLVVFGNRVGIIDTRLKPKDKELPALAPVRELLVTTPPAATAADARDLFLEPTEESPLPPKVISPPPLQAGPVLLPAVAPAPGAAWSYLLRQDAGKAVARDASNGGEPKEGAGGAAPGGGAANSGASGGGAPGNSGATNAETKGSPGKKPEPGAATDASRRLAGGSGGGSGGGGGVAQGAQGGADDKASLKFKYDWIRTKNESSARWGRILNADRLKLKVMFDRKALLPTPIRFRAMNVKTDRPISGMEGEDVPGEDIIEMELADTVQNRMDLWEARIGDTAGDLNELERFTLALLDEARRTPQFYARAEAAARRYVKIDGRAPRGSELLAQALREAGHLDEELDLYQKLSDDNHPLHAEPFVWRGLGLLEARLGLWADAEEHLRKAVTLGAIDPASNRALADFLVERGRAEEARRFAEAAQRTEPSDPAELLATRVSLVATLLACGDVKGAETSLLRVRALSPPEERIAGLEGSLAYARADFAAAEASFAKAAAAEQFSGAPQIGQGLCQAAQGRLDDAVTTLKEAGDKDPLLRHVALDGQGYALAMGQKLPEAIDRLEAARTVNPTDLYTLYLLGRMRRLSSQFDEAETLLRQALDVTHDFVEALGELALLELSRLEAGIGDPLQHLDAAVLYAQKACELEGKRGKDGFYQEILGQAYFRREELTQARDAFDEAIKWKQSPYARAFKGLIDYRQNRAQEALSQFEMLAQDPAYAEPYKTWVKDVIAQIKEHREKVQVRDRFERIELGNKWRIQAQGNQQVDAEMKDGRLRLRGELTMAGRPVLVCRAVDKSGTQARPGRDRYLSSSVTIHLRTASRGKWVGLEIGDEATALRANGPVESNFRARIGVHEGGVFGRVQDGLPSQITEVDSLQPFKLADALPPATGNNPPQLRVALELRKTGPRGADTELVFLVNDEEKKAVKVKRWQAIRQFEVCVFGEGDARDKVDVDFDDLTMVLVRS